jgi:hypothetical protein
VTIVYELGDSDLVTNFSSHFGDTVAAILILYLFGVILNRALLKQLEIGSSTGER